MTKNLKKILPNIDWDKYKQLWSRMEVPAKTIQLNEGEISNKAYLIEKGCLRLWFDNNGNDVTFQFFFENEAVSSIESFSKKQPSLFSIEAIENSIVYYITKNDFDKIMDENSILRNFLFEVALERQFNYMKHFLSLIKDKPRDRYLNLIKEKPLIIQRVPQHYIASYLGITPVSLSRIRNKR
jgi:CRP-like cAMP-binding protein